MVCCGFCKIMSRKRNDYKVSTVDGIELEPLGGEKSDKKNGVNKFGHGDSNSGRPPREGVAVCSQKRAFCVTAIVLGTLLSTALLIAYAGPQNDCPCAGRMPPGYIPDYYNNSLPFAPIATNGQPFPWLQQNLPNNVRPNRYMLTIHPNLTTLDVKGQVTIEFHVEKETNFIVLHTQDLNVTEKAIVGPKGFALKIVKLLEYPPRQQLYIEVRDKLKKKTNYTLSLRWNAKLAAEPEGFYVDQYEGVNGVKRLLAATVFEPGGARKAFPCFDEPHLRAPFRISVFRDRFHIGLSNSIVHATDDVGFYMGTGLLRDDFIETPALSPDAIAWVVSDFQRQSLEPTSTYQITSTQAPILVTHTTVKSTDNFLFKKDKRPNHNLTALITRGLLMPVPTPNETNGKNHEKANETTTLDGDLEIRTAPSYTFYASRGVISKSGFVLQTSRDVLEYLQTWLGVAYPLVKLDFVALPSLDRDLTSSLGLISLRTSFLRDANLITTKEYHKSAIKISEAILRQFFGGITSPKVYKYSWLWEGIIKYLGRLVLSPLQPLWPMDEMLLVEISSKAMDIDAIQVRASILEGSNDDGDIDMFYVDKSAGILQMLHSTIGEDSFRGCLGAFLNNHKFETAEPVQLWQSCTKQINGTKNIKEMMNLWTNMPGFPLLTVTKVGSSVSFSQKPFKPAEFLAIQDDPNLLNITNNHTTTTTTTTTTPSPSTKKRPQKWVFPVTYITNVENITDHLWFTSMDLTFNLQSETKWIKVNSAQNGYYRVLYDEDNWANLIEELKRDNEIFSARDRIGLISDAFTLCHANLMPCQITLNLVSYIPKEKNWGPINVGLRHLEQWRRILKYSECFLMLADFVRSILVKSIMELGWDDIGKDETRLLRSEVLLASVLWEEAEAIYSCKQMLQSHITNKTVIAPNLRQVVYTGAILSGEYTYWQYCLQRFTSLRFSINDKTERLELLRALGETKDAWLQNRLLSHVITLPPSEFILVLESIAGTPTGGAMACRFLQAKWFVLQSKFGQGSINFARVISAITQYGATKFDYDEVKSLVERFGDGPGMGILNMTLKSVAANVEWVNRSESAILSWVQHYIH